MTGLTTEQVDQLVASLQLMAHTAYEAAGDATKIAKAHKMSAQQTRDFSAYPRAQAWTYGHAAAMVRSAVTAAEAESGVRA